MRLRGNLQRLLEPRSLNRSDFNPEGGGARPRTIFTARARRHFCINEAALSGLKSTASRREFPQDESSLARGRKFQGI